MFALGWLVFMVFCLIIEGLTMSLVSIWFAVGAFGAVILALCGASFTVQIIAASIIAIICILFIRKYALKYFNTNRTMTNVDAMIGKKGVVIEKVSNLYATGKVKIDGMEWTARAVTQDEEIPADETIVVRDISGVKVIVEKAL